MEPSDLPPPQANGERLEITIPLIELGNCKLSIGPYVKDPRLRALTIGPLMLALPLTTEAAREVVRGLTGIEIAGRGDQAAS